MIARQVLILILTFASLAFEVRPLLPLPLLSLPRSPLSGNDHGNDCGAGIWQKATGEGNVLNINIKIDKNNKQQGELLNCYNSLPLGKYLQDK